MSEWQPIETAPKDGTAILAFIPQDVVYVLRWIPSRGAWREADGELYHLYQPTHWMPLPQPPST